MYRNPFYLGWNKGWSFLFFLEGGIAKIEAKGFGISMTTKVQKGESILESADRLVLKEQRIRKLSLIHISEPTRQHHISYAVFCLKKKISFKEYL